jgi:hypothetical protein
MIDKKESPISRSLQRELLLMMRTEYPRTLHDVPQIEGFDGDAVVANLWYLQEHGLCESGLVQGADGHFSWSGTTITARGLDFLEEDGGLSAILGVVTIKFHADTLREMLSAKIDEVPIPHEEKSAIKRNLSNLSETALKTVTTDLVQVGLNHIPNVVEWLGRIAGI